jgi:hypothetical protein
MEAGTVSDVQRIGLAIVLLCVLTRLSPSLGLGGWWNYVLIGLSSMGLVMLIRPARK